MASMQSAEEVFVYCDVLQMQGCQTSHQAEKELYKKFHWMTRMQAATFVKQWIQRKKLTQRMMQSLAQNPV